MRRSFPLLLCAFARCCSRWCADIRHDHRRSERWIGRDHSRRNRHGDQCRNEREPRNAEQRIRYLHVYRAAARPVHCQIRTSGLSHGDAGSPAANRGGGSRQLHDGDRHAVGDRRSYGRRAAHHDRKRDGRHRHREPAHRRAAVERTQLPVAHRVEHERQRSEFAGAGQAGDRQGGSRANQNFSISGQRREYNYYTLDGTDNTDVNFNTYILLPSVDALEEFKVQTGIYSAEFGRAASQVNVVTKSGTNQFHGIDLRVPPQRRDGLAALLVLGRTGGPAEAAVQLEPVRLHAWRPDLAATKCSSCRTGRATAIASSSSKTIICPWPRGGPAISRRTRGRCTIRPLAPSPVRPE